jgi:hypothetical protein
MQVPTHLRGYACDDYFASEWAERGCWDEPAQLMLISPAHEVAERPDLSLLVVGRPGVDGILFGYRAGHPGLWAYYPIDREFVLMAPSLADLVEGWRSRKLTV